MRGPVCAPLYGAAGAECSRLDTDRCYCSRRGDAQRTACGSAVDKNGDKASDEFRMSTITDYQRVHSAVQRDFSPHMECPLCNFGAQLR